MLIRTLIMTGAALHLAHTVQAQKSRDLAAYLLPDRAAGIALARSAAPAAVSDSAMVLVLTRTGFVEAARGTNGFTCAVMRSFATASTDPNFWNPKVRAPHCFSAPASQSILVEMRQRSAWIMAGVSPAEIDARTTQAYTSRQIPMPSPGAMANMISPQQYLQDDAPHRWKPHLMFYYDRALPAATWGAGGFSATVIDATAGDQAASVQTLLIPVQHWSDGSPALQGAEHEH